MICVMMNEHTEHFHYERFLSSFESVAERHKHQLQLVNYTLNDHYFGASLSKVKGGVSRIRLLRFVNATFKLGRSSQLNTPEVS